MATLFPSLLLLLPGGFGSPPVVGMGHPDTCDLAYRALAVVSHDVAPVVSPSLAVVKADDVRELNDGSRVLDAGRDDQLNAVRRGHVPLEPDQVWR